MAVGVRERFPSLMLLPSRKQSAKAERIPESALGNPCEASCQGKPEGSDQLALQLKWLFVDAAIPFRTPWSNRGHRGSGQETADVWCDNGENWCQITSNVR